MKRVIWKYPLKITDQQTIRVPAGWKFLSAQMQSTAAYVPDSLTVWFSVDQSNDVEDITLHVVGTGNPYDDDGLIHLATVQDRQWVWHLFREESA